MNNPVLYLNYAIKGQKKDSVSDKVLVISLANSKIATNIFVVKS